VVVCLLAGDRGRPALALVPALAASSGHQREHQDKAKRPRDAGSHAPSLLVRTANPRTTTEAEEGFSCERRYPRYASGRARRGPDAVVRPVSRGRPDRAV